MLLFFCYKNVKYMYIFGKNHAQTTIFIEISMKIVIIAEKMLHFIHFVYKTTYCVPTLSKLW
ncbi:hypothetical protein J43TS3_28510 [Ornithinibacillus bavariensis]|uniref:Uncharacterized protein n=1 Tax=Ornithinibacillus bavariensis TaxID=545502 RepID=A0A920C6W4_9BACI|nr:hypothetical protein J43TS3_28510 [Ornithinibacillus bavariensis]